MTTSTFRGTPTLAIPSTQNTAPILEFRCLYTHDLRRKSKRWQDGLLRFHTFNKRVMVYDVPLNYVGDTHWRVSGDVQIGDELELEKGILVQVGEEVRKIEQDLTGVVAKKGKNQGGSPVKAYVNRSSAVSRTAPQHERWSEVAPVASAPYSQLRPRSLNSLLGTPKGRHGRAMLPTKSPFEQKHDHNCGDWADGRAAKRQRPDDGQKGERQSSCVIDMDGSLQPPRKCNDNQESVRPDYRRPSTSPLHITHTKQAQQMAITIVDSESDPENVLEADLKHRKDKVRSQKSVPINPKLLTRSVQVPSSPPVSTKSRIKVPEDPTGKSSDQEKEAYRSPPANPLRLVARAPRKKLLYQSLPKSRPPPRVKSDSIDAHTGTISKPYVPRNRSSRSPPTEVLDALSKFRQAQQSKLKARMKKTGQPANTDISGLSQESQRGSEDTTTTSMIAAPEEMQKDRIISKRNPSYDLTRTTNAIPKPSPLLPPPPSAYSSSLDDATLHYWQELDQQLLTPSHSKPNSPLRRTRSELGPPSHDTHPPQHTDVLSTVLPCNRRQQKQAPPLPKPVNPRVVKPVDLIDGRKGKTSTVDAANEKDSTDLGPWSREAFDLFDWRPPEKGTDTGEKNEGGGIAS
ncbi:MAG: hypothetical protein M1827_004504 [Pycnora praestabilis]|nr:MAG: hypothetical protein M1827_004504 [Pycnora praestabilis]